jgi:hypothetical protein
MPEVGISLSAFLGLVLAVGMGLKVSPALGPRLVWTLAAVVTCGFFSTFVGTGIMTWILPTALVCAAWGVAAFQRTWDIGGALRGTFAMAYAAVLVGADTIHLWPNLAAIRLAHHPGDPIMAIGGLGWGDGLIRVPLSAITVACFGILFIVLDLLVRRLFVELEDARLRRRISLAFIPYR